MALGGPRETCAPLQLRCALRELHAAITTGPTAHRPTRRSEVGRPADARRQTRVQAATVQPWGRSPSCRANSRYRAAGAPSRVLTYTCDEKVLRGKVNRLVELLPSATC